MRKVIIKKAWTHMTLETLRKRWRKAAEQGDALALYYLKEQEARIAAATAKRKARATPLKTASMT